MAPRPLTAQMSMNLCQRPTRMSSKSSTLTPWAFSNRSLSFVMRSLMLLSVPAPMAAGGQNQRAQCINSVGCRDHTWSSCFRRPHFAERDGWIGGLRMALL